MSKTPMSRREALKLAGVAGAGAIGGALVTTAVPPDVASTSTSASAGVPGAGGTPVFTEHERRTLGVLVDEIIPRDERSGSATDANVPEFIEAVVVDRELTPPLTHGEIRGGLAWLDTECRGRFGRVFAECAEAERHQVLDDIAWPKTARPAMQYGVKFFSGMRDFVASGFFSSAIGHTDLAYTGNVAVAEWKGCPESVLKTLGVSYAAFDAKYGSAT